MGIEDNQLSLHKFTAFEVIQPPEQDNGDCKRKQGRVHIEQAENADACQYQFQGKYHLTLIYKTKTIPDILYSARLKTQSIPDFVTVISRKEVWSFFEHRWLEFVPFLHRLQGRLAAQG